MAARLCVLTLPDCCCCCGVCCCGVCGALLRSVWFSAFSSVMVFFAWASLFCRVFMASNFVLTRLASSSASLVASSNSFSSSSCCFGWFWKAVPTRSCSFCLRSSLYDEDSADDCLDGCEEDCFFCFFWGGGRSGHEHSRLSPLQTTHLLTQWKMECGPPCSSCWTQYISFLF